MSHFDQYNNRQWPNSQPSTINDTSHSLNSQQPGAPITLQGDQPRGTGTMNPVPGYGLPYQPPVTHHNTPYHAGNVAPNDSRNTHQPAVVSPPISPAGAQNEGQFPFSRGPTGPNFMEPPRNPQVNGPPSTSPPKCRIPDCTYNAYYDVAQQEQTEYCGDGHKLQAVLTGLVATCVMCNSRPRRRNEMVCGTTCREQERVARRVHGSYYGVTTFRRESQARQG